MKGKFALMLLTLALSILFVLLATDSFHMCPGINDFTCEDKLRGYAILFTPFMPVFLLSLFAYFLGRKTYKAWLAFSAVFVLFAIWILLHYDLGRGGGFGVATSGGSDITFLWGIYAVIAVPMLLGGFVANYLAKRKLDRKK